MDWFRVSDKENRLAGSSGSKDGLSFLVFLLTQVNRVGRMSRVVIEEKINPPMTACPRGATCSPPSPIPEAMGIIPAIMAKVVIRIGRNLDDAAHFAS